LIHSSTLPGLLREAYLEENNQLAFSIPENGKIIKESIKEFYPSTCHLSRALQQKGIKKGDKIALMGAGCPDWIKCDIAIQMCGAITVPFFPELSNEIFEYEIEHSESKAIICLNEDGIKGILEHKHLFSFILLKNNPQCDETSLEFEQFLNQPFEKSEVLDYANHSIEKINENDLFTIIYTSGSTGYPKGVELSHKNLIFQIEQTQQRFPLDQNKDIILSCLPTAHIFERMVVYFYISCGVKINFVDDINKISEYLNIVKPTIITLVPRLLEKVYAKIIEKIDDGSFIQKLIGQWAISMANHNDFSIYKPFMSGLAEKLVFHKLKKIFGGNIRLAFSGGAPLSKDLNIFFNNIGVPVFQGYGLTETSPVICANSPECNKVGTVGKKYPDVQLRINPETNEICTKGEHTMQGYHKEKEATSETIIDGWVHTGDCGTIDNEGFLTITGRIKEIVKTSNGKYVNPIFMEQKLSRHPLIDLAMVLAENKKFCSCVLFLDHIKLKEFMKNHQINQSVEELANSDFFIDRIQRHVDFCNRKLNHWEQIQKFHIIPTEVSIKTGELTPTMKLKRHFVEKKYRKIIEMMYNEPV
jgi:long-chain acyl-CoA synthetase